MIELLIILILFSAGIVTLIKKSLRFVFKPLENLPTSTQEEINKTLILKDAQLETNRIIEYEGEAVKSFYFYPQTWTQFIGQEEAKNQAQTIIKKIKKGIKAHLLLSAIQGHGKSTFVRLLAKSLNARLIERVGKQLDMDNLVDIINEINTSQEENVIFFLDETDTCDWKVLKLLNPILQDFKISNKKIKPFLFASATINKDKLIKTVPDLLDRISHHIQLTRYTSEEIAKILYQYQIQMYPSDNIPANIINIISNSCKYNPRLSISILEDYVITKDINKTLKDRRIVKDGLTEIDIAILTVLNEATRPLGANATALRSGLNEQQYLREFEPYLYEMKYINRTPSRIISEKGKQFLKEVNNV